MTAITRLVRLAVVRNRGEVCRGCGEYFPDYFDFVRHICPGNTR